MGKQIIRYALVLSILLNVLPVRSSAVQTAAASAILMDADSGRVLFEQNADQKMLIASTTKIMTALAAIRHGEPDAMVTVSEEAAATEGSSMYLRAGEKLTLEVLLYGLMLCSGNDAAVAIAEHIGGDVDGFAVLMNEIAKEIGMTSTSFANPNGLDHPEHYSTARDMALLARAAMEEEALVRIVSTRCITIDGRTMENHNKLLSLQDGCIGLKTGYTKAAGRTLVSCAERDGQRLIAVTLQDGNDWADHQMLYEYGFSSYPVRRAAVRGQPIAHEAVVGGETDSVPLVAAESFCWPLTADETFQTTIALYASPSAPLLLGEPAGEAVFKVDGEEVGRVEVLYGASVLPDAETAMRALKLYLPQ